SQKTFSYDPIGIGNLVSKSDVGTYTYPAAGQPQPHALTAVNGTISSTFTYDPNGNQTTGLGRSIGYRSYNKPASITQGSKTIWFYDGFDHQRYKQITPEATVYYFEAFGAREEAIGGNWIWTRYSYLTVNGTMIGMRILHPDSSVSVRYFHQD